MLRQIFLEILNISIRATLLIGCILVLRTLLKKHSNRAMTFLWLLVALRLLIPFTVKMPGVRIPSMIVTADDAALSEQPLSMPADHAAPSEQPVSVSADHAAPSERPAIVGQEDQPKLTEAGQTAQTISQETKPETDAFSVCAIIWAVGAIAVLAYNVISAIWLRTKLSESVPDGEVMLCDRIGIPFVFGLLRPRIYMPSDVKPEYKTSVIEHEKMHIRRGDNWKKLLYICVVTLHWFNPFVWLACHMFGRDCEIACDDDVTRKMDNEAKEKYILSILFFSAVHREKVPYVIGLSDGSVRERINNIVTPKHHKKTLFAACMLVGAALFLLSVSAAKEETTQEKDTMLQALRESHPQYFDLSTEQGLTVLVTEWTEGGYRCGVMAGQDIHPSQHEMKEISLGGVDLESVKLILSTYEIGEDRIAVVPFANLFSGYVGLTSIAPTDSETITMVRNLIFSK